MYSTSHVAEEVPQPTSEPPTPFLKSPYVYILVVGVVAVVPVVLGIVLCKKSKDRKDKVQYCRGKQLTLVIQKYKSTCSCMCTCMYVRLYGTVHFAF